MRTKKDYSKKKGIRAIVLFFLIGFISCFGGLTQAAEAATQNIQTGAFASAPQIKAGKTYVISNLAGKKAGYLKLEVKKGIKVSFEISGIDQGILHVQVYRLKNAYTTKLIHDMQVFAPSDSEIEKNNKKYTWDQESAQSVYLKLKPGEYYIRFETGKDIYSKTKAPDCCQFRVRKIKK